MKNVILEYASAVIAILGSFSMFTILGQLFLGQQGMIVTLITVALGGL